MKFENKSLEFLKKYLNTASPTGYEHNGQKIWMDYLKPYVDKIEVDHYGTCYGIINPEAEFKVVIEAHADEISWYVNYITDDGLIYVIRNGGSDQMIAPSKVVHLHGEKGVVKGVFGWPAIHTRGINSDEPVPKLDNIFIDCGASTKKEIEELGIFVGTMITYPDEFFELNNKYFVSRALDNRVGGFMIAEVARLLKKNKKQLPFGLYITNSVQEEVGLYGANMIADTIKPNIAIVTDVTHDTSTPMIEKKKEGDLKCGDGPVIYFAPSVHHNIRQLIVETAKTNKIPFQRAAASRATGTDTDAFAHSNGGVPSALISLPLRYMHTTVEMVSQEDVASVIQLIYETLLKIEPTMNLKYH
ncbi:M42 family metallopeptidase [Chryseobacterium sp. MDT2-18]|uniref:M42 family metallopeptidase n=1 Tax=Chryseobacterium sp. MDT2-18 TaxID=1259136 RepID=UPI00278819AD|nr:M42 family metallopeptidase [Chryseobacterium sp. MDT2-18]MDQ0475849.1 putative aminopeptidase FrvX [Chryseobacterium sp. MDT2-18]